MNISPSSDFRWSLRMHTNHSWALLSIQGVLLAYNSCYIVLYKGNTKLFLYLGMFWSFTSWFLLFSHHQHDSFSGWIATLWKLNNSIAVTLCIIKELIIFLHALLGYFVLGVQIMLARANIIIHIVLPEWDPHEGFHFKETHKANNKFKRYL